MGGSREGGDRRSFKTMEAYATCKANTIDPETTPLRHFGKHFNIGNRCIKQTFSGENIGRKRVRELKLLQL